MEENFSDLTLNNPNFNYIEQAYKNPISKTQDIRCYPWKYKNFCLVGDAAHTIFP